MMKNCLLSGHQESLPGSKSERSVKGLFKVCKYKPCVAAVLLSIVCPVPTVSQQYSKTIEDNSFLIEEAYNQETGVVQHISNGIYTATPERSFFYSFTQEWPLFSQKHQISYTVPCYIYSSAHPGGVGNLAINYRYQLFDGQDWAAVAPRFSMVFPTAAPDCDLNLGAAGFQMSLPVSKRLSELFAAHLNIGISTYPSVRRILPTGRELKNTLIFYNFGGSLIWLANQNQNVMLEYVTNVFGEIDEMGRVISLNETTISPGYRQAIDIGSLQIVPGIAFPIALRRDGATVSTFLYLSFEHPF